MQTFTILWQEPVEVKYQFEMETGHYSFQSIDLPEATAGIYQIIADHPLYGKGQTLYIGKAQDIHQRNVQRFQDTPLKFWRLAQPIKVGMGLVYDGEGNSVTDDPTLSSIEALLIARHIPALNSAGLGGISDTAHNMLVLNEGYTNGLLPDCANTWFKI